MMVLKWTGLRALTCPLLALVPVLVTVAVTPAWSACHQDSGPPGDYDCFFSSRYDGQYQWGTCLTNTYIMQKSKGRHACADESRTYCYYQCMLEVHGTESGNVTSDCSCDVNNPMTTPPTPTDVTTLSPQCFSPNGTDCAWFSDCLEARFRCSSGPDDYGIMFGQAFCRLYENRYATVSLAARSWIDSVRKCLQVELVPLMRDFESPTCSDIKRTAFKSHTGCYVEPFPDEPSVCALTPRDFWEVFWTLRIAFSSDFVESVLGLMEVRQDCEQRNVRQLDSQMRKLMLTLDMPLPARRKRSLRQLTHGDKNTHTGFTSRRKRETSDAEDNRQKRETTDPEDEKRGENSRAVPYHQAAGRVCGQLARQLHWEDLDVLWFAYGVHLGGDRLQVHILLADKALAPTSSSLFNSSSSSSTPSPPSSNATTSTTTGANLTAVVALTLKAFELGQVTISAEGKTVLRAGDVLSSCPDLNCSQASLVSVTAPPPPLPSSSPPTIVASGRYRPTLRQGSKLYSIVVLVVLILF